MLASADMKACHESAISRMPLLQRLFGVRSRSLLFYFFSHSMTFRHPSRILVRGVKVCSMTSMDFSSLRISPSHTTQFLYLGMFELLRAQGDFDLDFIGLLDCPGQCGAYIIGQTVGELLTLLNRK